jgi:hypothetical protein
VPSGGEIHARDDEHARGAQDGRDRRRVVRSDGGIISRWLAAVNELTIAMYQ